MDMQAMHGHRHGTEKAREVKGRSLKGSVAMPDLLVSVLCIIPLLLISGTGNTCAGDGFEVVWQVAQWQSIHQVSV